MVALGVVAKSLMTIHPYVLHGACGWRNMVALGVVAKSLITILDLGQPIVILDEGMKDIHEHPYRGDHCARVYGHTTGYG